MGSVLKRRVVLFAAIVSVGSSAGGLGAFVPAAQALDSRWSLTASLTLSVHHHPGSAPTISGVSPSSGPATGGTSVTITGSNLTGATAVRFGAAPASTFAVNSATQITATAPAGSGSVDVTATTPGGTSATGAADQFTYLSAQASSWVVAQTPQPSGGGGLEGVSCPTATMCVAVGYQNPGPAQEPDRTLAENWNGQAWSIQPTPNPAGFQDGQFNAVSCTSVTFCMGVGFAFSSPDTYRTLAEVWNGSSWTIEPTATPGTGGHLDSVSCTSPTDCIAGGLSGLGQLAEHWDGSAWTVMTLSELPDADFGGISCTQATSCTAVGTQLVSGQTSSQWQTLAEHWNGSTWTVESTPNPTGNQDTLNAVSCLNADFCVSAGSYGQGGLSSYAFSATWNGTTWTATQAPYRTGTNGDYLTGITCFTTTNCIAAGFTQTGSANSGYATLVDQWNGSSWTTLPSPAIPSGDSYFQVNSASCATPTDCAAVGGYVAPGSLNTAFIMQTTG